MVRRLCQCCCSTITDSFFPEGSLDDYDQRSGDWSVDVDEFAGSTLEVSDDDAILIRKDLAPTNVTINTKGIVWPQSARVIIGWLDDDNYHYVECLPEVDGLSWMRLRIVEVASGVESELTSRLVPFGKMGTPSHTIKACYDGETLSANVVRFADFTAATIAWRVTLAGTRGGIGVGLANSPSQFFSPKYEIGSGCVKCGQGCCSGPVPSEITVVLNAYDNCPSQTRPPAGTYIAEYAPTGSQICRWIIKQGDPEVTCEVLRIPGVVSYYVAFTVAGAGGTPLTLYSESGTGPNCEFLDETPIAGSFDCDGVEIFVTGDLTADMTN